MENKSPEISYRYWQDRATPFYMAARILYKNDFTREASVFCGFQAIENFLKGALDFYGEKFDRRKEGHVLQTLLDKIKKHNVVLTIPVYFNDFQDVSRYPESKRKGLLRGSGLFIPASFMDDLDKIIYKLIFQISDNGKTRLFYLVENNVPELIENNKYFSKFKNFFTRKDLTKQTN